MPPKGWRKGKEVKENVVEEPKPVEVKAEAVKVVSPEETKPVVEVKEPVVKTSYSSKIAESREALKHPLEVGQEFYEAPDGYIIVAEAKRGSVLYRGGNDGKGMLINPRRV